ncbi:MAG: 23S rRNA (pseudouridine(1915)-N(3))-methyltransferase RlmH [Calditrichaeota bacterium]|nr:MAG: 23S rRNA (pseudouridine(1915)-N(3))-methyltransferase RlmH [Calditrichota bacterium]
MLRINIYTFGKLKKKEILSLTKHYQKCSTSFAKIEFVETKESRNFDDDLAKIVSKIKGQNVFALTEFGKEYSTLQFVEKILKPVKTYGGELEFVVFGAFGISQEKIPKNWQKLSLSKLTFPHEIAALLLVEQIYRSLTILNGKTYHY